MYLQIFIYGLVLTVVYDFDKESLFLLQYIYG